MKQIKVEREKTVTLIVSAIALIAIFGGFASFSGLSVHNPDIEINDAGNLLINPVTFLAEESIVVYVDDEAVGVIALKKYLDDHGLEYGSEVRNSGQNNIEIITLRESLVVDISDMIGGLETGTYVLKAEFSLGDGVASGAFVVE